MIAQKGEDASYQPVVAIGGSVWIIAALNNSQDDSVVSSQYHAEPLVPVTAVFDYSMKRCSLLIWHKFIPIFIPDGQRFPLKSKENSARQEGKDFDVLYSTLYEA